MRRANRQIPVDPGYIHLLGYEWPDSGSLYFDRCFPFGCRSAAFCCQRVTSAIAYLANDSFGADCVNYLDDFGGVAPLGSAWCHYYGLRQLFSDCGIEESTEKACPPSTTMTFLGIEVDSINMEVRVTPERLHALPTMLVTWLTRESATLRELQSLVGQLVFVSKCVRPGRLFVARLLEKMRSGDRERSDAVIALDAKFQKDIQWWITFLQVYNGVSIIKSEPWSDLDSVFATDACLDGCGAVFGRSFFHAEFPVFIRHLKLTIASLEALCVVVAVRLWGHLWTGHRIQFACDNIAVVQVINSGRARDKFLLSCLRELCFLCATNEFEIHAVHIPGTQNRLPDLLSRWGKSPANSCEFFRLSGLIPADEVEMQDSLFQFSHDW